jgi:hypothetical protein
MKKLPVLVVTMAVVLSCITPALAEAGALQFFKVSGSFAISARFCDDCA